MSSLRRGFVGAYPWPVMVAGGFPALQVGAAMFGSAVLVGDLL